MSAAMRRGQSSARRLPDYVRSALALAILVASGACRTPDSTQLVVGIQSDPMGGIVSALHIVIRVAGAVVTDEVIKPPRGSRVGFPQPWEKALSGAGKGGARVDVEVDALGDPSAPAPLLRREPGVRKCWRPVPAGPAEPRPPAPGQSRSIG